jgi:formylglycine-generating enzyme required for sulfatase activity
MRGVRYIREEPNIRRTTVLPDPIVLGGLALACGVFAWLALRDTGRSLSTGLLEEAKSVTAAITETASTRSAQSDGVIRDCVDCPEMVVLPTGFYTVGATDSDPDARPQEKPRRSAVITRPFAMAKFETTGAQYQAFVIATGRSTAGCAGAASAGQQPQNCLSYDDATAYAAWLSAKTGRRYRLPTADEWEYAATAHGLLSMPAGAEGLLAVDQTAANGFGLHGMRGNLAELVVDCWIIPDGEKAGVIERSEAGACVKRTVKDGSWLDGSREARVTAKRAIRSDARSERVGVRLVREIEGR